MSTPRGPGSGRYATGQLLALILVALVALPLFPLLVVVVAWIRLRDRRDDCAAPRAGVGSSGSAPPTGDSVGDPQ